MERIKNGIQFNEYSLLKNILIGIKIYFKIAIGGNGLDKTALKAQKSGGLA